MVFEENVVGVRFKEKGWIWEDPIYEKRFLGMTIRPLLRISRMD